MTSTFQSLDHFQLPHTAEYETSTAMSNSAAPRERRPSTSAPISDLQGPVGPAGMARPKHKRTFTGLGAGEIKIVEGEQFHPLNLILILHRLHLSANMASQ
jgi:starch phosphorylase